MLKTCWRSRGGNVQAALGFSGVSAPEFIAGNEIDFRLETSRPEAEVYVVVSGASGKNLMLGEELRQIFIEERTMLKESCCVEA